MGEDVAEQQFSREDRERYREKVKRSVRTLRRLLDEERFETDHDRIGLELEIYLVDRSGTPMMVNEALLERIESEDFQTELGQFNIEFNLPPRDLAGTVHAEMESQLREMLNHAQEQAESLDARMLIVGILPTLTDLHVTRENLSRNPRYQMLNDQILRMRGEDLRIEIEGAERLATRSNSIMMEAASTSMQLHLQVDPDDFARYYNAAQAISAVQIAVGSNSPFFLGKQLWHETRIALFEQSIDTRPEELRAQGVRPRVWFGDRWIDSAVDLYEENVSYFPALMPMLSDEDPLGVAERGGVPEMKEMALHNGTIWRWNRPVYGSGAETGSDRPHLRVENRVLPAGPTVVDAIANTAFYYGLIRAIADLEPPISTRMSFSVATENFFAAARDGLDAAIFWPNLRDPLGASQLITEHLLPLAHEGLDAWGVDPEDRDRYLGIIEERSRNGRTGSTWQIQVANHLYEEQGLGRDDALLEMTRRYIQHMHGNEPVHTWPVPSPTT